MLKLRILRGHKAGQYISLKPGDNIIGRNSDCDIVLPSPGISKRHAKITVQGENCVVTDLASSNGTFVNGTKVNDRILKVGDRVGFHDVIMELLVATDGRDLHLPQTSWSGNLAYQQNSQMPAPADQALGPHQDEPAPRNIIEYGKAYVEKVVLPGLYRVNEIYPTKNILGAFILGFVFLVTSLSTVPMASLMKEGIQREAQRRALTIARQLATSSEKALATGNEASIRTDAAESEDGVTLALIISKEDGHIIAPLTKAQSYSNEEFVARARKHEDTFVDQLNATTIGASVPIKNFSTELGQQLTVAYALVVYKMDSLDWSATVGLFARVLVIALALSAVLYFFLYRILIQPIREASVQLDQALRGERDTIIPLYDFDVFTRLVDNINSALSRMGQPAGSSKMIADRGGEACNLVRIVSDPAFAVDTNGVFLQVNSAFEELVGMRLLTLQGQKLETLQDQAMRLNLEDLIQRALNQIGTIVTSQLEISGINHEIDVQAISEGPSVAYVFGTFKKRSEP